MDLTLEDLRSKVIGKSSLEEVQNFEASLQIWRDLSGFLILDGYIHEGLLCKEAACLKEPSNSQVRIECIREHYIQGNYERSRYHSELLDLSVSMASRHDFTSAEKEIYALVQDYAIQTPESVIMLHRSVKYCAENDLQGSFVECGVFKGGSAVILLHAMREYNIPDRSIYLFDTFEGMTKPDDVDIFHNGISAIDEYESKLSENGLSLWVNCSLDKVIENIKYFGFSTKNIFFIKGDICCTLPNSFPKGDVIAILRLDTDFYKSTKYELIHLFPRLNCGGILIIDDYGAFSGAKLAVDEYVKENNINLCLMRVDSNVRFAIKQANFLNWYKLNRFFQKLFLIFKRNV